jgi:hypothetical protein
MAEDEFQQERRHRNFQKDARSTIKQTEHLNNPDIQWNEFTKEQPNSQLSDLNIRLSVHEENTKGKK